MKLFRWAYKFNQSFFFVAIHTDCNEEKNRMRNGLKWWFKPRVYDILYEPSYMHTTFSTAWNIVCVPLCIVLITKENKTCKLFSCEPLTVKTLFSYGWAAYVCKPVCVFVWAQQNLHSQALRIPTNLKHINSIGLIRTSNAQRKKQE